MSAKPGVESEHERKADRQGPDDEYRVLTVAELEAAASRDFAERRKAGLDERKPGSFALSSYVGPLSTIIVFGLVVLKVLVVAHLDRVTALGLVSEGGTGALLAGTIMSALGPLAWLTAAAALNLHAARGVYVARRVILKMIIVASILIVFVFGSVLLLPLIVLAAISALLLRLFAERSLGRLLDRLRQWRSDRPSGRNRKTQEAQRQEWIKARREAQRDVPVVIGFFVVVALVFFLDAGPWLPSERVTSDSHRPVTGYVLRSSPEGATVLEHSPRRLVRIEAKVRRTICTIEEPSDIRRSMAAILVVEPANYPRCRDLRP